VKTRACGNISIGVCSISGKVLYFLLDRILIIRIMGNVDKVTNV